MEMGSKCGLEVVECSSIMIQHHDSAAFHSPCVVCVGAPLHYRGDRKNKQQFCRVFVPVQRSVKDMQQARAW